MSHPQEPPPYRLVVLISGSGTNLQRLIDLSQAGQLHAEVVAVVSNRSDAYGLERARHAGIATVALDHRDFESRDAFDQAMIAEIDRRRPDLVVLAGFMRILTDGFVEHYQGRMINIHPSLLPQYRGLNTHQRALDDGAKEHGCSVHFVTAELDGGPIIAQAPVPVYDHDNAESLARRVQEREHHLYPACIQWLAEGRLKWQQGHAYFDGEPLPADGIRYDRDFD